MKILNPKLHGALDYMVVIFLWSAPLLFGLSSQMAIIVYVIGSVHLILTLLTKFPFGLIRIIPLKRHGDVELIVSIILITTPLYIGDLMSLDSVLDKFFLAGFGVIVFAVWFISDYSFL